MSEPKQAARLIPKNIYESMRVDDSAELVYLKLPSSLRIQMQAFDPETYQMED